jgi:glycosyltransferase involved in cell wall biosynthesis
MDPVALHLTDAPPASPAGARSGPAPAARRRPIRLLSLTKSTGGIAQYNRLLLSELAATGVESHTLCLSEGGDGYAAALRELGLGAEALPMERYRLDPLGDLRLFRRVLAIIRARRPDVVLCHGSKPGVIARAAGRIAGAPTVYCQASMPFLRRIQGAAAPLYWGIEVAARGTGGHLVALTASARETTIRRGVTSRARSSVISTGVDLDRFRDRGRRAETLSALGLDPARPVIGWLGRFEPQKAPADFAAALAILARDRPDLQTVVAGEGALRDDFAARVRAAGLERTTAILPWQSDMPRLLEAFDVFALTSLWEGLPMTLLEAMACGVAPVATAVDGSAEAIEDGVSGLLAPPGDPSAMAAAIGRLLGDPSLRARLSAGARARIETRYEKGLWLARWRLLLERLADGAPVGDLDVAEV